MPQATISRERTGRVSAETTIGAAARDVTATISRGRTGGVTAHLTVAGAGD